MDASDYERSARERARSRSSRLVTMTIGLALTVACGGGDGGADREIAERPDPPQLTRADTGDLRPELAAQVEDAWRAVDRMATAGYPDRAAGAAAIGDLAHLYFAFDLLADAETAYGAAAELAADDPAWPYYVGLVRQARVDPEGALAAFRQASELDPDDVPSRIRLGNALLAAGELEPAERSFEAAAANATEDLAAVHYGLGQVATRQGDPQRAIVELERALELQPTATVVHYQLAQQYRRTGDAQAAQRHLALSGQTRVIFPDPRGREVARHKVTTAFEVVQDLARDPDGLSEENILGFAIVRFGDVGGALAAFSAMLEERQGRLEPLELSRAYWVLGALQARQNDHQAAIDSLEKALAADPEFVAAKILLASRLARVGRGEEALQRLDEVLSVRPDDPDALLVRATVRIDSGLESAGIEDLERLVTVEPENSEGWIRLAAAHQRGGRLEQALDGYRTAQDLPLETTDRVLTHLRSADLLVRLGRLEEAESELDRAIALEPGAADARTALATLRARQGDLGQALSIYREVQSATPGHRAAWVGEATVLTLAGRSPEAVGRLQTALEALPGDPVLMQMLARQWAASPEPAVRDGRRSLELARRLVERFPSAESYETLAMALAENGQFDRAVEVQRQLIAGGQRSGGAAKPRLERNLELYLSGTACCAVEDPG